MKSNKTAGKNKDSKKAAKKELQQNLSDKFFEVVKSLGHDAEKIGEDLILVSKFVAKKLSRKVSAGKKAAVKKVDEVLPDKAAANKMEAELKKPLVKGAKKAEKVVQKASARVKPVVNSVKVAAIASEDSLKKAIERPVAALPAKTKKAAKAKSMDAAKAKNAGKKVKPAGAK